MVFSSTVFLFTFLPVVLGLYYLCPAPWRNGLLLGASLVFYGWGEPKYIFVMIGSIGFNYLCGLWVEKMNIHRKHKSARLMLALCAGGNLLLLGWFKYAGFAAESLNSLLGAALPVVEAALPIGISFYTFQAMSYVIDVYRRKTRAQKSLVRFAVYITLFPQLIAGPIVRYVTIEEQLGSRSVTAEGAAEGIRRFIIGLGKKVLLANQAGMLWEEISAMDLHHMPAVTAWLGAIAFTFQIYFDFSGYSDMAIGLGRMLGFRFDENFRYPYMARSITDFWRRWHISLSTWFKEYVYIPLGGNRRGPARQMVNILIVWALTGLWHGASWNFLWWGLYFALLLILEKLFLLRLLDRLPAWLQHGYALLFIVLGWVIFSMEDGGMFWDYIRAMGGAGGAFDLRTLYFLRTWLPLLAVMAIGSANLPAKGAEALTRRSAAGVVLRNLFYLAVLILSTAFLVSDTYNPFLYFRF